MGALQCALPALLLMLPLQLQPPVPHAPYISVEVACPDGAQGHVIADSILVICRASRFPHPAVCTSPGECSTIRLLQPSSRRRTTASEAQSPWNRCMVLQ